MITLTSEVLAPLDTPTPTPQSVIDSLHKALRLEHATIPPYLYSLFSLKSGKNKDVAGIIDSVVIEEMLHMVLVANVMNALGGDPRLAASGLFPVYPGPLPDLVVGGLKVGLEPCSLDQIRTMFMAIEQPEKPKEYPTLEAEGLVTIGLFYTEIIKAAEKLPAAAWHSSPRHQIPQNHQLDGIVEVTDLTSAKKALQKIIEQGEGTETDASIPGSNVPAHYYRFRQISEGKRLIRNRSWKVGDPLDKRWSYTGTSIGIEQSGVYPVPKNPKTASYTDPDEQKACRDFNRDYTEMLQTLENMMTGQQGLFDTTVEQMHGLAGKAKKMVSGETVPGRYVGPSFEYEPA